MRTCRTMIIGIHRKRFGTVSPTANKWHGTANPSPGHTPNQSIMHCTYYRRVTAIVT